MIRRFTKTTPVISLTTSIEQPDGSRKEVTAYLRSGAGNACAEMLSIDSSVPFFRGGCASSSGYKADAPMIADTFEEIMEHKETAITDPNDPMQIFVDWAHSYRNNNYGWREHVWCGVMAKEKWANMFSSRVANSTNNKESLLYFGDENGGTIQRDMIKPTGGTGVYRFVDGSLNKWVDTDKPNERKPEIYSKNVVNGNDLFVIRYNDSVEFKAVTDEIDELKKTVDWKPIFQNFVYANKEDGGDWGTTSNYPIEWSPIEPNLWVMEDFVEDCGKVKKDNTSPKLVFEYEYDKWLLKCLQAGKIVNDNAEDVTDYYVKITDRKTVQLTWKNDFIDIGNSEVLSEIHVSGIVKEGYNTEIDEVLSFGSEVVREWSNEPIEINLDSILNSDKDVSSTGRLEFHVYQKDGETIRNWCYWVIRLTDRTIVDYGQGTVTDYHDRISIGEDDSPTPKDDPDEPPPDTPSDPPVAPEIPGMSLNLLTRTYACNGDWTRQFANFLWNGSLLDSLKLINNDPIGNVVSVKIFPLDLSSQSEKNITLGNVDTGVKGDVIVNVKKRMQVGSLTLSRIYGNFNDFEPYTTMEMFIPFLGYQNVPCEVFYGKTDLLWTFDFVTGLMMLQIMKDGYVELTMSGNCGVEVPIAYGNRAELEKGYIGAALNPLKWYGAGTEAFKTSSIGSPSPDCGLYTPYTPFLKITTNEPIYYQGYRHQEGYACRKGGRIGNFNGFTCIENVELTCPCTEQEKKEILSLLNSGVYL